MKKKNIFLCVFWALAMIVIHPAEGMSRTFLPASDSVPSPSFHAGIRFERAVDFYWYNGVSAEYTSPKLINNRLGIGFNFLSSRLGTAMSSNAIPFYEIDLSGSYYLRNGKSLQPYFRLNTGFAKASYGDDVFRSIPDHAMILSVEAAMTYRFNIPVKISLGGGYNVLTGNGSKGLATIFPAYGQCSVMYRIF